MHFFVVDLRETSKSRSHELHHERYGITNTPQQSYVFLCRDDSIKILKKIPKDSTGLVATLNVAAGVVRVRANIPGVSVTCGHLPDVPGINLQGWGRVDLDSGDQTPDFVILRPQDTITITPHTKLELLACRITDDESGIQVDSSLPQEANTVETVVQASNDIQPHQANGSARSQRPSATIVSRVGETPNVQRFRNVLEDDTETIDSDGSPIRVASPKALDAEMDDTMEFQKDDSPGTSLPAFPRAPPTALVVEDSFLGQAEVQPEPKSSSRIGWSESGLLMASGLEAPSGDPALSGDRSQSHVDVPVFARVTEQLPQDSGEVSGSHGSQIMECISWQCANADNATDQVEEEEATEEHSAASHNEPVVEFVVDTVDAPDETRTVDSPAMRSNEDAANIEQQISSKAADTTNVPDDEQTGNADSEATMDENSKETGRKRKKPLTYGKKSNKKRKLKPNFAKPSKATEGHRASSAAPASHASEEQPEKDEEQPVDDGIEVAVHRRPASATPAASDSSLISAGSVASDGGKHLSQNVDQQLSVVLSSGVSIAANTLTKFKNLGHKIVDKPTSKNFDLLVVAADTPLVKTFKLLYAVALSKPLVTAEWILDMGKEGKRLPYHTYYPHTNNVPKEWGVDAVDSADRRNILKDHVVYISPALKSEYGRGAYSDIDKLCKAMGAKQVVSTPFDELDEDTEAVMIGIANNDPDITNLLATGSTCYTKDFLTMSLLRGACDFTSVEFQIKKQDNKKGAPKKTKGKKGK